MPKSAAIEVQEPSSQEKQMIRIAAGQMRSFDRDTLRFVRQLGVTSVQFNTPPLPDRDGYWLLDDLRDLREQCEDEGLVLEAIENVPMSHMMDFLLGGPDADLALANYCRTIENMGRAGIPVLGYHFLPTFVWRTSSDGRGRGGARVTSFDADDVAQGNIVDYPQADPTHAVDEPTMWHNYERFLKVVLPVAEGSGVRLALHPDDPPVPAICSAARLFYSVPQLERACDLANGSPAWTMNLCLGTVSEMADPNSVIRAIDVFGEAERITSIHFRDVQGRVPRFQECFLGEGNFDPIDVMAQLRKVNFTGFILDDHVPGVVGDTAWGHRARAHAIGYLQAILHATANSTEEPA